MPPDHLTTHYQQRPFTSPFLVTIPIGDRHCFSQRFSPMGFILNAPDSTAITNRSALAFRLKPIRSVQSYGKAELVNLSTPK